MSLIADFPERWASLAAQLGAGQARLTGTGLIRASGLEAASFLQGQLSNDVREVSAERAQLSGYCSPKGRLLSVFHLLQLAASDPERGASFGLECPAALLPATLKRLRMFVLRAKLTLDDGSADWQALGVWGDAGLAALAALGLPVPERAQQVMRRDGLILHRRPGEPARVQVWGSPAAIEALADELSTALGPADAHEQRWHAAELLAGVPVVRQETVDVFVPQTANLDSAGGISFTKGCYPGQEIVARVHYLGRLKQRLHACTSPVALAAGAAVHAGGEEQAVGTVMDCAPLGGQWLVAVVLQLSHAQSELHGPDRTLLSTADAYAPAS